MSMSPKTLASVKALLAELRPRVDAQAKLLRALAPTTEAGKAAVRRALAERRITTFMR